MAEHLNEEEQIEAIKRWWNENGRSIIIGVVLAVVGYFGWQGWQAEQQKSRETASLLYEDLLEVATVEPGQSIDEEDALRAEELASQLKSDHSGSIYASNAALLNAKLAVKAGELDKAAKELQWVIDAGVNEAVTRLARLRLAQVQYGQGEYGKALASLEAVDPETFTSAYNELRGDILLAQGEPEAALKAYQNALDNLLAGQSNRRDTIQMKMDSIQTETEETATVSSPEETESGTATEGGNAEATQADTEADN